MDGWIVWLIVAAAFGIGEMATNGFFLAPFAAGGVLAAAVDLAGSGTGAWITFVAASIATLVLVRPLAVSHLNRGPTLRTNAAALIGRKALVLERIENHEGGGRVKIDGEVWTARSLDDDHVIEAGTRVEVVDIKGATALVME
jgi:membrane protein implicated in regulation of membrane protease activity